jgi:PPP family 3-phenylpropionic acid transporter
MSAARHGAAALFFAHFLFVGIYAPYLGLWLDGRGLSIVQIALLLSLPQWLRIVAPPFWGWLSDRTGRRIGLLRVSAVLALGLVLCFPFAQSMVAVAAVMLLLSFMTAAHGPIGEAIALEQAQGDVGRYGRIRLWGSVGFVATVVSGGWALDLLGVDALPWIMAVCVAFLVGVTLLVPESKILVGRAARADSRRPIGERLREPQVIAFFVSAFLMIAAHGALYSFWSIYLERHGYSRTQIGLIWAVGVVAEIALFAAQRALFVRFDAMRLLAASFLVCAVRFALVGLTDAALWVVLLTSLMHAVTFGVHHSASMAVMHRWFDPSQQAQAQAAFIVVGYGLGGGLGGLGAAWLWEQVSPGAAFLGSAAAALLGWGAVVLAMRLGDPRAAPRAS